jgi:PAS domain S-box-containing protein
MKWMRMTKLAYLGFFTALIVLIFLSVLSILSFKQNNENDHWVQHTYKVLQTSNLLMSALKDAETSQRGYVITGDPKYLSLLKSSTVQKDSLLPHLVIGTKSNPIQRQRVRQINDLIQKKYTTLTMVIAIRNTYGLENAIRRVSEGQGKILMDRLRLKFKALDQEETRLLREQSLKKDRSFRTIKIVLFIGMIFIVFVFSLTFFSLMKQIKYRKRNEEALFIQNDWFTQTLISLGDGVITTDIDGVITMINKAACSITGWSMYDAVGEPLEKVFHIINPITGERTKNPALTALEKRSVILLEENTMLVRKDGSRIYIDDSGAPIHRRDGEIIGAVLIFRDITERKKAVEERDLFYNISVDMIGIASIDGFFKNINPAFEKILGYTEEEFLSHSFMDYIHPDDIAKTVDEVNQLASGQTSTDFLNRFKCKNGNYKWIEWNITPVGELLYATGRDITERKKAAEALAATFSKFYQVLESTPVSIVITDTITRKIIYVNDSFCLMTGYDKSFVIGKSSLELQLIDINKSNQILEKINRIGFNDKNMETQLTKKDGQEIDVLFSIEKLEIEGNLCYIGSLIDITERKRAENNIKRMNQYLEKRVEKRTAEIDKQKRFTDDILSKIPTEIAVYDAKERYLYVNPKGIESDEIREWIIGKTDFDYCALKGLNPAIAQRRNESFSIVKKNKNTEWIDEIIAEDGATRYMLRILHALEGNKKFILTGYDITALKIAEQKNQEYITSLEEMMFITSHKMRHPVTQIMGIESLLDYTMSKEELEKVIGYIKTSINSLDTYTHELTMFIHNSKKNNTK